MLGSGLTSLRRGVRAYQPRTTYLITHLLLDRINQSLPVRDSSHASRPLETLQKLGEGIPMLHTSPRRLTMRQHRLNQPR